MTTKFYLFQRATDSVWIFGSSVKSVCPAGSYRIDIVGDNVTIHAVFNRDISLNYGATFADYLKENGNPYASIAEFEAATIGFFCASEAGAVSVGLTDAQLRETAVPVTVPFDNVGVCNGCIAAVLSETVDLSHPGFIQPRLLEGNIKVTDENGNVSTLAFDKKEISAFRVKRVWVTGTTANMGIVVIY